MTESQDNQNKLTGDLPAEEDKLGFTPYVIAIAKFLTNPETKAPLTISIEGEWGSGKSSFMKQLKSQIKKESEELEKKKLKEIRKNIYKDIRNVHKKVEEFKNSTNDKIHCKEKNSNGEQEETQEISDINLFKKCLLYINNFVSKILKLRLRLRLRLRLSEFKFKIKLRLSEFKLSLNQETQIVWFNAWRHDKAEALWAVFALEFIRQTSRIRNFRDFLPVICGKVKLFVSRFYSNNYSGDDRLPEISITKIGRFVLANLVFVGFACIIFLGLFYGSEILSRSQAKLIKSFVEKAAPIGAIGTLGISIGSWVSLQKYIIGDLRNDLKKIIQSPNYQVQVPFIETFHADFRKIVEAYVGKDEKVYVFIDDLDRCELGKSADLLQALNLMISNNSNLVFILGIDREKVAAGITFKQKGILDFLPSLQEENQENSANNNDSSIHKLNYGFSYMEKFIQLPFSVPKPSEENILKDLLGTKKDINTEDLAVFPIIDKGLNKEDDAFKNLMKVVIDFFDRNPRRLKQYINLLTLKTYIYLYSIGVKEKSEKLTIEQIGKFVALTLKHPRLLFYLQKNNELLAELEKHVKEELILQNNSNEGNANYWINSDPKIKTLLRWSPSEEGGNDKKNKYTLRNGAIKKLLDVSPQGIPSEYFQLREYLEKEEWLKADLESLYVYGQSGEGENKDFYIRKLWEKYTQKRGYRQTEEKERNQKITNIKQKAETEESVFLLFNRDGDDGIYDEYFVDDGNNDDMDDGNNDDIINKKLIHWCYLYEVYKEVWKSDCDWWKWKSELGEQIRIMWKKAETQKERELVRKMANFISSWIGESGNKREWNKWIWDLWDRIYLDEMKGGGKREDGD